MKKILAFVLATSLALTPFTPSFGAMDMSKEPPKAGENIPEQMQSGLEKVEPDPAFDENQEVTAIIELDPKVTSGAGRGNGLFSIFGFEKDGKTIVQETIEEDILNGENLEIIADYDQVINGFAAKVPFGKLDEIRRIPEVLSVYVAPTFKIAPDVPSTLSVLGGMENTTGYNGEGMKIAIIDSGLEVSHDAFRKAPSNPAVDKEDIAGIMDSKELKARELKPGVTADQLYYSEKIPFVFDYADKDVDVVPGRAGDHGTHVTGIACANTGVEKDVSGIASEAQIYAMKVFSSDGSGGATWDSILSAIEDAMTLDADVVNMSLGSVSGFASTEFDESVDRVYKNVEASGVMLSVAAGNEYSSAFGNKMGKGHQLAKNPDYGTTGEPGSYAGSLAVASIDIEKTTNSFYMTVDGNKKIAFNDSTEEPDLVKDEEGIAHFRSLAGRSLDYVLIPGYGEENDYKDLDVTGKLALVARGRNTYDAKRIAAKKAGAAGIIVYNNEPGMLYMQFETYNLPGAFISQSDGEYLAARNGQGLKIVVSDSRGQIDSPTSGQMSDFSSWGVTPELTLKPEITAPGANIKSTVTGNNYGNKSGTSMAAPYVGGAMAIVKQYVKHKLKTIATDELKTKELVSALLMSTADVVREEKGLPYSPRKQGAGSVNLEAALKTKAFLSVPGQKLPKVELGDDPSKTGSYLFDVKVTNFSDSAVTYEAYGNLQTDGVEVTKSYKGKDVVQVTERPYNLSGTVTLEGGSPVTIPANSSKTLKVSVNLSEDDKNYLDANFENGSYVEGFVVLKARGEVTLSLPYMGFYGDWTKASMIDRGYYWNDINDEENWATQYTNTAGVSSLEGSVSNYLGDNPYHRNIPYLSDRNAISPNGDDTMDALDILYTGLLRNAKTLKYTITGEDGEVYFAQECNAIVKSVYSASRYRIVPAGVDEDSKIKPWFGTAADGSKLPDGTRATVKIEAQMAYDRHGVSNECTSWEFPIIIDITEPEAKDLTVVEREGAHFLSMKVSDNQYVSNVCIANGSGDKQLASYPVAESERGKTTEVEYNVTGFGENLTVVVNDYAGNRKEYKIKAEGNVDDSEIVIPTKKLFTEDFEKNTINDTGWEVKANNGKTWQLVYDGYGSKVAQVDYSKSEQNEWLISPSLNLKNEPEEAKLVFDFFTNYFWSVENHHHNVKVKISDDGGNTWEDIWQLWNVAKEFEAWGKVQGKVNIPEKYQNSENVKIAFVYEGCDGTSFAVDNVILYADNPDTIHSITATASAGGSISPSGTVNVNQGKDRTFTITPDEGYFIKDVTVDGKSVGTVRKYKFENVTEDHEIHAEFGGEGAGSGNVVVDEDFESYKGKSGSDLKKLPDGWNRKVTNTAYTWEVKNYSGHYMAGCSNDYYEEDGGDWGWGKDKELSPMAGGKQDEFMILPACDLTSKTATLKFDVSANVNIVRNGYVTATVVASKDGGNSWQTLWNAKDHVSDMKTGVLSNYIGTLTTEIQIPGDLESNSTLIAFRYQQPAMRANGGPVYVDNIKLSTVGGSTDSGDREMYEINATAGMGGNISPYGLQRVSQGSSITFNITPSENYRIKDVKVDSVSVGRVSDYTFEDVQENHRIEAEFEKVKNALPESIHEDFNSDNLPEGWNIEGPSKDYNYESWKLGRYSALNNSILMLCTQNIMFKQEQNEKLIMPEIKLGDAMKLTFNYGGSYNELSSGSVKLSVKASLDKGESWREIWNARDYLPQYSDDDKPEDYTGIGQIDIPAAYLQEGTRFAFVFESKDRRNATVAVDNVNFEKSSDNPAAKYAVLMDEMTGGTVSAKPSMAAPGETVKLTVKPDQGYKLREDSLRANGEKVVNNQFTMPEKNVKVTAIFDRTSASQGKYKDGEYYGTARGRNGDVTVKVTVESGRVAQVEVTENQETPGYFSKALAVIDNLLGIGSNEELDQVDAVSGATLSSKAIKQATKNALEKAVESDSSIFASGNGTRKNPYIIATVKQLLAFAEDVNNGNEYQDIYIALGTNLDLSKVQWTPVGYLNHGKSTGFRGIFDGKGYRITNVNCGSVEDEADREAMGFFGVIGQGGQVKNLNITISKYYNKPSTSGIKAYEGGIAGVVEKNGIIDHCSVQGGQNAMSSDSQGVTAYVVGGIAGRMEAGSLMANSWSDVGISAGSLEVDSSRTFMAGGLCGEQCRGSLIANCASFGLAAVSAGDGDIHVGGLVGDTSGLIYNCYTTASTRGNNILNGATNPTTALGFLVGSSKNEKALYNCYYDNNANMVKDFTDQAGEPDEGKTERRVPAGFDSKGKVEVDTGSCYGLSIEELSSEDFALTMNEGNKSMNKKKANEYFESDLVSDKEDLLEEGYMYFKLVGDRVLMGDFEEKPDNPDIPDQPDNPDNPDNPDQPDNPKPEQPGDNPKPDQPGNNPKPDKPNNGGGGSSSGGAGGRTSEATKNVTVLSGVQDKIITEASNYRDVKLSDWFAESVLKLSERGILKGKTDKNFEPFANITRAEFVAILARLSGDELKAEELNFRDVSKDSWFNPYVDWSVKKGITTGTEEVRFSPNVNISRQDMAVMISRYLKYKKIELQQVKSKLEFADDKSIADYAWSSVTAMQKAGIINGSQDESGRFSFRPNDSATRAEAAKMISQLIEK